MKKLILSVALLLANFPILAEEAKTYVFIPDVRLSVAYDYKTWENSSYSGSDSLQLA